ncbi:MAG: ankyrin-1-like isoform X1 [Homavirus sp.]|uniref:Ankyrin-1-like isoform X1 n=1 Tax=Homavirus sp. TaxID=2487769 RepID=A0A3G5A5F4_9VIRU|nr:MAG: ankyrin-1-like isoform X1 [Homavirus sp.]
MTKFRILQKKFYKSIEKGDVITIENILQKKSPHDIKNLIISHSRNVCSPLLVACKYGNITIFKLLANYIDFTQFEYGIDCLKTALDHDHLDIFKLLLNKINITTEYVQSFFVDAVRNEHTEIVTLMLARGADINKEADLLKYAFHDGNEEIIKLLIHNGININVVFTHDFTRGYGCCVTPLHIACELGYIDVVILLLEKGASIYNLDNNGCSPIFDASTKGHIAIVELLLQVAKRDGKLHQYLNSCDIHGRSLLQKTIKPKRDMVIPLITHGADIIQTNSKNNRNILFDACVHGYTDIVEFLINHKDYKRKDGTLNTDLLNIRDEHGFSPIHMTTNPEIIELLSIYGANINAQAHNNSTPLSIAIFRNNIEGVKMLIKCGANVNQRTGNDIYYTTPLHIACTNNGKKIVELLLKHGANICTDSYGKYPLHDTYSVEIIQLLLDYGAISDHIFHARDTDGQTPLFHICNNGYVISAKKLLDNGADIDIVDNNGDTPLSIAQKSKNTKMVEFLEKVKQNLLKKQISLEQRCYLVINKYNIQFAC